MSSILYIVYYNIQVLPLKLYTVTYYNEEVNTASYLDWVKYVNFPPS